MVKPRTGIICDVGPFIAYTKLPATIHQIKTGLRLSMYKTYHMLQHQILDLNLVLV